jgi:hypothetical protein
MSKKVNNFIVSLVFCSKLNNAVTKSGYIDAIDWIRLNNELEWMWK